MYALFKKKISIDKFSGINTGVYDWRGYACSPI